ncbi:MAG: DUF3782 domain-containing protein [Candidatus Helarchaeota archaeon]
MDEKVKEEIREYLDKHLPTELEKYYKIYSSEELVTKTEILELIDSMNRKFDAVDKRFEAADKRFEELIDSMNRKFEEVDKRFEELIDSMNRKFDAVDKRFEAADKRFEELIDSMNRRFEAVDKRFEELIREIQILKVAVCSIGDREGKAFEKTIKEILKENIKKKFIDLEKVEKIRIKDANGEVVLPNQRVEIDIFASNGRTVLIEVKFHMTVEKLVHFYKKAQFVEKIKGFKAEKLVIAIEIDDKALDLAEDLGIDVITSHSN